MGAGGISILEAISIVSISSPDNPHLYSYLITAYCFYFRTSAEPACHLTVSAHIKGRQHLHAMQFFAVPSRVRGKRQPAGPGFEDRFGWQIMLSDQVDDIDLPVL